MGVAHRLGSLLLQFRFILHDIEYVFAICNTAMKAVVSQDAA
jgi:hypothetical protein